MFPRNVYSRFRVGLQVRRPTYARLLFLLNRIQGIWGSFYIVYPKPKAIVCLLKRDYIRILAADRRRNPFEFRRTAHPHQGLPSNQDGLLDLEGP